MLTSKNEGITSKNDIGFYLTISESIKASGKLPMTTLSKQALNYYVRRLKIGGVIKKIGYGTWQLDQDNLDRLLFQEQVKQVKKEGQMSPSVVRGHGFGFTLKLPLIQDWDKRSQFLHSEGIAVKNIKVGYGVGQSIVFKGYKVWLLDSSVVVHFPKGLSIWGCAASGSRDLAFFRVRELLSSLEAWLKVSLKIGSDYKLKLFKQHYGDLDNLLAKQYDTQGKKLRVVHSSYGEWLLIDASKPGTEKFVEMETIQPSKAHTDMDGVVKPFFNDLLDYSEINNKPILISEAWQAISKVTASQELFAKNIQTHIKAIQDLSKGVDELRGAVKDISEESPKYDRKKSFLEGLTWNQIIK